jgi:hypothetical protein
MLNGWSGIASSNSRTYHLILSHIIAIVIMHDRKRN